MDVNNTLKSGTEHLNAFLNTSNCCTLCIKITDHNTLEANDKMVSEIKIIKQHSY